MALSLWGESIVAQTPEYDVIVSGAGIGGSVVALQLAQDGYRVLVLEQRLKDQRRRLFGARPFAIEILSQLGLQISTGRRESVENSKGFYRDLPSFRTVSEQREAASLRLDVTVESLQDKLQRHPLVDLRRGVVISEVLQGAEQEVEVRLTAREKEMDPTSREVLPQRVRSQHLIVAEGLHSQTLSLLPLGRGAQLEELAGPQVVSTSLPRQTAILFFSRQVSPHVPIQRRFDLGTLMVSTPFGSQASIILPPQLSADHQMRYVQRVLQKMGVEHPADEVSVIDVEPRHRLSLMGERLQRWGRVHLIGDSLAVASPWGGLGSSFAIWTAVQTAARLSSADLKPLTDPHFTVELERGVQALVGRSLAVRRKLPGSLKVSFPALLCEMAVGF